MTSQLSLIDLPQVLLKQILSYARDPFTLISCERTCHALKNIVADDSVWGLPPDNCEYRTWNLIENVDEEGRVFAMNERVVVDIIDWMEDTRFVSNRERLCLWGALEKDQKGAKKRQIIFWSQSLEFLL